MTGNGSQRRWRSVRRYLNRSRAALTETAARLADEWPRLEPALITYQEWLPTRPVPLERVRLTWQPKSPTPRVTGTEPQSFLVRPLRDDGQRYGSYAEAMRDVDPPGIFENRPCYRLLGATREGFGSTEAAELRFGLTSYFEGISVSEAVAHELASACMGTAGRGGYGHLSRTDLPLRTLVGEPGDLESRPVAPALCTLTLRHEPGTGEVSFLMHRRDPDQVASGGGMLQVAPVGVFQPTGLSVPETLDPDFDLWRCMMREFSEELLGSPEHTTVDYATWPFAQRLEEAREKGHCRPYYLGVGVDPLTLVADLLTVVVFDAVTFDEVFADLVSGNQEGDLIAGIEFTEPNVLRYSRSESTQPAGAAVLELAWRHRAALLA
ncbi:MAG TPA: XRE family transcriptional regulator [Micromonosporaceae bacterium]|jgi:hypothetical protein